MEYKIPHGVKHYEEIIVTKDDSSIRFGSGQVLVYATPALVALLEKAAHNSVQQHLPMGTTSVGSEISLKHLKATPIGGKVRADSYLKSVSGRRLHFELHAWDENGLIGIGTHARVVVEESKFMDGLK